LGIFENDGVLKRSKPRFRLGTLIAFPVKTLRFGGRQPVLLQQFMRYILAPRQMTADKRLAGYSHFPIDKKPFSQNVSIKTPTLRNQFDDGPAHTKNGGLDYSEILYHRSGRSGGTDPWPDSNRNRVS
jgi:hypothetical protein